MLISGHKRKYFFAAALCAALPLLVWGCSLSPGERGAPGEERVIARVNDYEIFDSDLAYAFGQAEYSERITPEDATSLEALEMKLRLMDQLVTRKVLIREAQKQDFDKKPEFMKEIERYWEQALLKFILNKKSKELMGSVTAEEWEIRNEYRRKQRQVFAELIFFEEVQPADMLSEAGVNFDPVKEKLVDSIILEEPPQWWVTGDLPRYLEDYLFALSPGDVSSAIIYEDNWAVMRVLEIRDIEIAPLDELRPDIVAEIKRAKSEKLLEEWIEGLKKNSSIEINYEMLKEIRPERAANK